MSKNKYFQIILTSLFFLLPFAASAQNTTTFVTQSCSDGTGTPPYTCSSAEICKNLTDTIPGLTCVDKVEATTATSPQKPTVFAQNLFPNTNGHFIPDACTGVDPNVQNTVKSCGIKEILQVVLNVSRLILGVLGSVTLVMFIYGGVIFLTSAGSAQRVQQGKTILLNAVIGVIIVLFAWVLVSSLVGTITGTGLSNPKVFGTDEPLTIPGR